MPASSPVRAFIDAAYGMGLPKCPDLNVPEPYGVCASPYNIKNGKRQSTTIAYLDPIRARPNLTIIAEATVHSLQLSGKKAEGVRYEKNGEVHSVLGGQILLTAGVYGSPQILMLSGIGQSDQLKKHDIPVVHELKGIGENYQDHPVVFMTFEGPRESKEDWVVPRFRLIIRKNPISEAANFHINMRPPTEVSGLKRMMPVSAHLLEQRNRGRVFLQSADPQEQLGIDSCMLEHPEDLKAMIEAMQFIDELVHKEGTREFYGPLIQPGPGEDWGKFARSTYDSYHHGVGTCKMGPASDNLAVVDQRLRVHGIANLWVGDASIMPVVSRANTNLTSIMIGERLADFVQEVA
jgi:choline dehydrogenase